MTNKGWPYDSLPPGLGKIKEEIKIKNNRSICMTSTTLNTRWYSDYGKLYNDKLVQIEVQFGKIESMCKDFCGFRIASYEKRLALGIEIVFCDPIKFFAHRKAKISGMANFNIAKNILSSIGFSCPIWLVGLKE